MSWWSKANDKVDQIIDEEITKKREAGKAGRN